MSEQITGTVCERFNAGHAYIQPDDGNNGTVFIHRRALNHAGIAPHELKVGTRLRFDVRQARYRGLRPEATGEIAIIK